LTAAFTGWPSLTGTFDGLPFRGIEPTGKRIGQNIMDFYVRRDDKLHLNWVLIDLIDFAAQCGVDLLKGLDRHG
jgi:predicted ester cyclase